METLTINLVVLPEDLLHEKQKLILCNISERTQNYSYVFIALIHGEEMLVHGHIQNMSRIKQEEVMQ